MSPFALVRSQLSGLPGASMLVTVAVVSGIVGFDPTAVIRVDNVGTSAWLATETAGAVALFDGSLPEQPALALARVAEVDSSLDVLQTSGGAIVLDEDTGLVSRVDGATREVEGPSAVFQDSNGEPEVSPETRLVKGRGDAWVVGNGKAQRIDRGSASRVGDAVPVPMDASQFVVSADNSLWMIDDGLMTSTDSSRAPSAVSKDTILVSSAGSPVGISVADGRLYFAAQDRECNVDLGNSDNAFGTDNLVVVVDSADEQLYFIDSDCDKRTVAGLPRESTVSAVVESNGWLYVVDDNTHKIWIVNIASPDKESWTAALGSANDSIELVVVGGLVFFNEPSGTTAGVVAPSGEVDPIEKVIDGDSLDPGGRDGEGSNNGIDDAEPDPSPEPDPRPDPDIVDLEDEIETDQSVLCLFDPQQPLVGESASLTAILDQAPAQGVEIRRDNRVVGTTRVTLDTSTAQTLSYVLVVGGELIHCPSIDVVADPTTLPLEAGFAGPVVQVREGDRIRFASTSKGAPDEFLWTVSGDDSFIIGPDNESTVEIQFGLAGATSVSLHVVRSEDEQVDEVTLIIAVGEPLEGKLDFDLTCPHTAIIGELFWLRVEATSGSIETIRWTLPSPAGLPPHNRRDQQSLTWQLEDVGVSTVEVVATGMTGEEVTSTCSIQAAHDLTPWIDGPAGASSGVPVEFTAAVENEPDDLEIRWEFGDGTNASGLSVSHVFAADGQYTVRATASAAGAVSASATHAITIGDVVLVPDVRGIRQTAAAKLVRGAELLPVVTIECSTSETAGLVLRQAPGPGEPVERAGEVELIVATGPRAVPDISSFTPDPNMSDAKLRLATGEPNLTVDWVAVESEQPHGNLISQSPAAGSESCSMAVTVSYAADGGGNVNCTDQVVYGQAVVCTGTELLEIRWGDDGSPAASSSSHVFSRPGIFSVEVYSGSTRVGLEPVTVTPTATTTCELETLAGNSFCTIEVGHPDTQVVTCEATGECTQSGSSGRYQVESTGGTTLDHYENVTVSLTTPDGVTAEMTWRFKVFGCG